MRGGGGMFEGAAVLMGVACVAMMVLMCVPMVIGMFKKSKDRDE
jgi:hypothetical protein